MTAHRAAHGATHLTLHLALAHRTGTLTHRSGTLRAALRTVATGARGKLRSAARQLGRAAHRVLLLRRHRLRARYCGGHGGAGTALVLRPVGATGTAGALAHAALLLVLRGGTRGCGQLGAQVLVLAEQTGQLGLDLI
ncbi:hypothetical protein SMD44_02279 [Streptomyces alboflavus]|uniref:Uncharacterized protein n=1 Tax=Streptomyces alboflavus TaxID=67267 RepID=A0A1Z1W8X2_9ACTN|nr:hypothetical protein SMD44_02279 [Streptomyces alboflavus]